MPSPLGARGPVRNAVQGGDLLHAGWRQGAKTRGFRPRPLIPFRAEPGEPTEGEAPCGSSRGRRQGSAATVATNFPKNRKVKTTALFHGRVKGGTGHSRTNATAACSRRPGTSSSSPAVREERQERQEPVSLPSPPGRNPSIIQFGKNLINKIKRKENGPGGRRERGARSGPGGPRRLPLHAVVGACGSGAQTTVPEAARLRPPCAGLAHSRMQSKKVSRASPNSYFWQKEKTKEKRKFVSGVESHGGETVRS